MKNEDYGVYMILRSIAGKQKAMKRIFYSQTLDLAKLYFKVFLEDEQRKNEFNLYKIGNFKNGEYEYQKTTYITNGYLCDRITTKEEIEQLKLNTEKASKAENNKEMIKLLFGGKEIER